MLIFQSLCVIKKKKRLKFAYGKLVKYFLYSIPIWGIFIDGEELKKNASIRLIEKMLRTQVLLWR